MITCPNCGQVPGDVNICKHCGSSLIQFVIKGIDTSWLVKNDDKAVVKVLNEIDSVAVILQYDYFSFFGTYVLPMFLRFLDGNYKIVFINYSLLKKAALPLKGLKYTDIERAAGNDKHFCDLKRIADNLDLLEKVFIMDSKIDQLIYSCGSDKLSAIQLYVSFVKMIKGEDFFDSDDAILVHKEDKIHCPICGTLNNPTNKACKSCKCSFDEESVKQDIKNQIKAYKSVPKDSGSNTKDILQNEKALTDKETTTKDASLKDGAVSLEDSTQEQIIVKKQDDSFQINVDNAIKCPNCGNIPGDMHFCKHCGSPLIQFTINGIDTSWIEKKDDKAVVEVLKVIDSYPTNNGGFKFYGESWTPLIFQSEGHNNNYKIIFPNLKGIKEYGAKFADVEFSKLSALNAKHQELDLIGLYRLYNKLDFIQSFFKYDPSIDALCFDCGNDKMLTSQIIVSLCRMIKGLSYFKIGNARFICLKHLIQCPICGAKSEILGKCSNCGCDFNQGNIKEQIIKQIPVIKTPINDVPNNKSQIINKENIQKKKDNKQNDFWTDVIWYAAAIIALFNLIRWLFF